MQQIQAKTNSGSDKLSVITYWGDEWMEEWKGMNEWKNEKEWKRRLKVVSGRREYVRCRGQDCRGTTDTDSQMQILKYKQLISWSYYKIKVCKHAGINKEEMSQSKPYRSCHQLGLQWNLKSRNQPHRNLAGGKNYQYIYVDVTTLHLGTKCEEPILNTRKKLRV